MLMDPQVARRGLDLLNADDFFRHSHRLIYVSMARVAEEALGIDFITIRHDLTEHGELDAVGGPSYITGLTEGVGKTTNIEYYAEIIKELRIRRQIAQYGAKVQASALGGGMPSRAVLDEADRMLNELVGIGVNDTDIADHAQHLPEFTKQLDHRVNHKYELLGISTGLPSLDETTCGLVPTEMTVLAGQTSAGKTALAIQIGLHAAKLGLTTKVITVFESIEMSRLQVQYRIASHVAGEELFKIRKGWLYGKAYERVQDAMRESAAWPFYIDEAPMVTVRELRAKCRRLASTRKIGLIIVDYLQLLSGESRRGGGDVNRASELGEMSRGLKLLAGELETHVIALAQLSREPQKRQRRPELSDLRESGAIEQTADAVWMLYRDESKDENPTELLIRKQRNGPLGVIDLHFDKALQRFHDLAAEKATRDEPVQTELPPFSTPA